MVIIGGGPAGYEAALVAAARGPEVAEVTVIDCDGLGGPHEVGGRGPDRAIPNRPAARRRRLEVRSE